MQINLLIALLGLLHRLFFLLLCDDFRLLNLLSLDSLSHLSFVSVELTAHVSIEISVLEQVVHLIRLRLLCECLLQDLKLTGVLTNDYLP